MAALSCQHVVEIITDYLEGAMSWLDRRRFEKHLRACDGCTEYLHQMRQTLSLLGTVPVDTLSPDAQSTLLDAFRDFPR